MILSDIMEYCPTEDEDYMNDNQLAFFRRRLVNWRCELVDSMAGLVLTLQEAATRKADPVDQSAVNSEMVLDVQSRNRQRSLIRQIDYALDRIEEGEYGYCEISGEPIGLKRLLARPVATLCIDVQERFEQMSKRGTYCDLPFVMHA